MENRRSIDSKARQKVSGLYVRDNLPISSKLTVNQDDSTSKGLYFFATCHNGDFVNHANGYSNAIDAVPTNISAYQRGKFLRPESTTDKLEFENESLDIFDDQITLAVKGRLIIENPLSTNNYFFSYANVEHAFAQVHSTNDYNVFLNGGSLRCTSTTASINTGQMYQAALSFNDGEKFFIIDGIYNDGVLVGAASLSSPTTNLFVGNRPDNQRGFQGDIEYIAMWNRALFRDELIEFQKNPYRVLKPA